MKITKYILSFTFLLVVLCAEAQQLRKEAFDLLNLDYPGLERVKAACDRQQWDEAAKALLDYLCIKAISLLIITAKISTGNIGRYRTMSCVGNCIATNGSPQWVRHIESLETRNMPKNGHTNIWIGLKRIL